MKIKTSLSLLALVTAAGLPTAAAAQFAGLTLPTAIDATDVFSVFVCALVALTVFTDYGRRPRLAALETARRPARPAPLASATHPLAA